MPTFYSITTKTRLSMPQKSLFLREPQTSADDPNTALSLDQGGWQEYAIVNARHAAEPKKTGPTDDETVTDTH